MEEGGDWDLQAVVRSCSGGSTKLRSQAQNQDHYLSHPLPNQQEETETEQEKDMFFIQNPDFFLSQTSLQELDDLYKPFFPKSQTQIKIPKDEQPKVTQTCSGGVSVLQQKPNQRSKRRKIQQKRVVCHVPADGLSADLWAWRKYGQKPIKGSPHPRGYYKCSSSKGCPARKQVERSITDQNIFIITYTGEHNHSVPTHRNSLAGSTRQKFTQPLTSTSQQTPSLSPTTPFAEQEGEVVEEEEGEGVLLVTEMEVLVDDDMLFLEHTS